MAAMYSILRRMIRPSMNILKYELKSQAVSTVIWTMAIGLVFWGLMVGVYPLFQDSVADTEKIFESFPPQFAAVFGLEIKTIFSFSGYYGFCFGYLGLMEIKKFDESNDTFKNSKKQFYKAMENSSKFLLWVLW